MKEMPEILDINGDFTALDAARQVSFQGISLDIKKLETGYEVLKKLKSNSKEDEVKSEVLVKMDNMIETAAHHIARANKLYEESTNEFKLVCEYIGESSATAEVEGVFTLLLSILRTIDTAVNAVISKLKKLQSKTRRRSTMNKRKSLKDIDLPSGY